MSEGHALLSASGAGKWFNCPPSARLEAGMPDEGSEYAREGTLAHKLAELTVRYRLMGLAKRSYTASLKKLQAEPLYSPEMLEHVENFAAYVAGDYQVESPTRTGYREKSIAKHTPVGGGVNTAWMEIGIKKIILRLRTLPRRRNQA